MVVADCGDDGDGGDSGFLSKDGQIKYDSECSLLCTQL